MSGTTTAFACVKIDGLLQGGGRNLMCKKDPKPCWERFGHRRRTGLLRLRPGGTSC